MESPLSFFRMHWGHEPFHTPGQGTRPTPCRPGALTGRFMQSPLDSEIVHWGHEPLAVPRWTESADKSDALQTLRAVRRRPAVARRLECVRLQRRCPKAGCNSMAGSVYGKPPRL